ncbi:murein biosynthesis integral membrane protein MurJ [Pilimelia columellifera]|uniref:murein biosynthesis integral membrane protein MurJ n=1 Tax=Pilimelia columellifera TaxID=706574 RepID=UPI0031D592D2
MTGRVYRSAHSDDPGPIAPPARGSGAGPAGPAGAPAPGVGGAGAVGGAGVDSPAAVPPEPDGGGTATNSAVMALGGLVSRGTGFVRTVAIVAALGVGAVGDAYGTAQFFPSMIYELLLGGILTSVLVPVLVRRRKDDQDGGEAYTHRLLTLAVLALGVVTLLAVIAAPLLTALLAGERPADYQRLVTLLSYLMLPMMFFTGLSALLGAVLNTRGHFAAPMWAPILNNLVVIAMAGAFVVIFGSGPTIGEMGAGPILLLGGGTLLGVAGSAAGLWPALRKVGFRWRWRGGFRELDLPELGRLGAWMFCYVAVSQVGVVVLLRLLNSVDNAGDKAGVASYNVVYLLLMMAHGIIAVSIITALMPRMSAAAHDGRFGAVAADLSRGARMSAAVLAPVAVVYLVLAQPLVITLFQYGAVRADDAERMAAVLVVAALALVPFAVSQLFTFGFYALPDTRTPALVNIPVVAVRVLVQLGLFWALSSSLTAVGIMIGNAVSYVLAAGLSAWLLRRRVGPIGLRRVAVTFGKVTAAAAGAGLSGWLATMALPWSDAPTWWQAVLKLTVGGVAIAVGYLGLSRALRIREIDEVVNLVRAKLGR